MRRVLVANLKGKGIRIKPIKKIARRVLECECIDDVEVSIVLTDDGFIKELNRRWRGVDSPTDLIAFPFTEKKDKMGDYTCLGEVVISLDAVRCQAKELGHSIEDELKILLIHGILHLLGYDHNDKEDSSKMEEREKELEKRCQGL